MSDVEEAPEGAEKKGFQFPSTMTLLILVTLLVWIAAFLIPSGTYQHDENGVPQPGSFQQIDSPQDAASVSATSSWRRSTVSTDCRTRRPGRSSRSASAGCSAPSGCSRSCSRSARS
jgi:hypothetical protein